MDTIDMILTGHRPLDNERVPINIHPDVRFRLAALLTHNDEFHGVGYSQFIERAVEVAETAIAQQRRSGR